MNNAGVSKKLALVALVVVASATLPWLVSPFYVRVLLLFYMSAVLAVAWNILGGFAGYWSFGHAAFFGMGAFGAAHLGTAMAAYGSNPVTMVVVIAGATPICAIFAAVIAYPLLRLRGIYFAIATLSFTEVLRAVVHQLPSRIAGGAPGLNVPALFRPTFVAGEMERWEVAFIRNEGYFLIYAAVLVFTLLLSIIIQRTRLRYAFTAVRTNQEVAAVMGVNPARTKLLAFVLSSVPVGLLGAVAAHRFGSVNPFETFSIHTTVLALVTPIFGGLYTTVGPLLGATVLAGIEETLRRSLDSGYMIAYGVVLVFAVLFMPRGLVGLLGKLFRRRREAAK